MNKKVNKKMNIVLYTFLMLIVFVLIAVGIIYGYGGNLLYEVIVNYPQGSLVISEAIMATMVLIVMLLFKNSYVFTQKKESVKVGLFYGLYYLIGSVVFMLLYGVFLGGFKSGLSLINVFLASMLIGVCEEFLCRGWLLNEFLERYGDSKKGVWYSIIISGLIFGLMHLINIFSINQAVSTTITQVISATGTGIFFGLIYYKTKNIWSVIILHGLWDFSLFIGNVVPVTETVEVISAFSIIGILFNVLMVFVSLLNIVPYINDIDAKPKKSTVITYAIVSFVLFLVFTIVSGLSSTNFGKTYEYGTITMEHYAVTKDNYEEYKIDYVVKNVETQINESGELIENVSSEDYLFELKENDNNNLVLTNLNSNDYVEIECESLYDYIIFEDDNNYVLAYVDYSDNSNAFLNYIFIAKDELSNDSQYLTNLKNNIKKYLLPMQGELLIISDYDNNKSYLGVYDRDYGYYLLVNEDDVSILNRK